MCFFFNDTATTEIYTLSLHDALPIFPAREGVDRRRPRLVGRPSGDPPPPRAQARAALRGGRSLTRGRGPLGRGADRKSTRLNSSHANISYAVFCLKKKNSITTSIFT